MAFGRFHLENNILNLQMVDNKYNVYTPLPFSLAIKCSKEVDMEKYGHVYVNGLEIPKGKHVRITYPTVADYLLLPVGTVANIEGKVYVLTLRGFMGVDGERFMDSTHIFITQKNDKTYNDIHDTLQLARESMVLLENDGLLPLVNTKVLNCFGTGLIQFRTTSVSKINPKRNSTIFEAIKYFTNYRINQDIADLYKGNHNVIPSSTQLHLAHDESDVAIIFITRSSSRYKDNHDVEGDYYLSGEEMDMIEAIRKVFDKIVLIVNTDRPIDLQWTKNVGINSIIYTGFSGEMAAIALLEIISGRESPSGRLSDSWPVSVKELPSYKNYIPPETDSPLDDSKLQLTRYFSEDVFIGYRYYTSFERKPLYCFGHGLSYGQFEYSNIHFDLLNQKVEITLDITNKGNYTSKEVVQVYIQPPQTLLSHSKVALAGYTKTGYIDPQEKVEAKIVVDLNDVAIYDRERNCYLSEKGEHIIYVATNSRNLRRVGSFIYRNDKIIKEAECVLPLREEINTLALYNPYVESMSSIKEVTQTRSLPQLVYDVDNQVIIQENKDITFKDILNDSDRIMDYVNQFTEKQLIDIIVNDSALADIINRSPEKKIGGQLDLPKINISEMSNGLFHHKKTTLLPTKTTLANTFNDDLAYRYGAIIAKDCVENNIDLVYGPEVIAHRNILSGAHTELFSEDPLLCGMMIASITKGLKDNGVECIYHDFIPNISSTLISSTNSVLTEWALYQQYVKPIFISTKRIQPKALTVSRGAINGISVSQSREVVTQMIRKQLDFDGLTIAENYYDPVKAIKAGYGYLYNGGSKVKQQLEKAVEDKLLTRKYLVDSAVQVVKLIVDITKNKMKSV